MEVNISDYTAAQRTFISELTDRCLVAEANVRTLTASLQAASEQLKELESLRTKLIDTTNENINLRKLLAKQNEQGV